MIKGLEYLSDRGEAESWDYSAHKRLEGIISIFINTRWRGIEKMETDASPW